MAASTPSGIDTLSEASRATSVSSSEAGSRVAISVATGCPVDSDWPQSPVASSRT